MVPEMARWANCKMLLQYVVTEMGLGWNHSWYRDNDGNAVDIFPYPHTSTLIALIGWCFIGDLRYCVVNLQRG